MFTINDVLNSKSGKKEPEKRVWYGIIPEKCDLCHKPINDTFIDGGTKMGPWANMCSVCHIRAGRGLGIGKGQKYQKQSDSSWLKIEG